MPACRHLQGQSGFGGPNPLYNAKLRFQPLQRRPADPHRLRRDPLAPARLLAVLVRNPPIRDRVHDLRSSGATDDLPKAYEELSARGVEFTETPEDRPYGMDAGLGLDRDSGLELLAADFDERDPALKALLSRAITACKAQGKYVGICGQGPSDHPDFARWLADQGITSISLNPDSVIATWRQLAGD